MTRLFLLLLAATPGLWPVAAAGGGGHNNFWKGLLFGVPSSQTSYHHHHVPRGGADMNATLIEEYVAAVEKRDAQDRQTTTMESSSSRHEPKDADHHDRDDERPASASSPSSPADTTAPAAVGVKSHKKSGSVGDADSDDNDDDDDDDDDSTDTDQSDWEEFQEDMDSMLVAPTQLEVEVEFVEDEEHVVHDATEEHMSTMGAGGGVGVILNQRRRNNRARSVATATFAESPVKEQEMMEAWLPHVYFPPGKSAMEYLSSNARMIDGASKSRLDRRTLYACLLMEWLHANATYRKFLEKGTSQALQAALALATQPQWRRCSSQRLCGIRMYDETERGLTLAMQETITMALVRTQ